MQTSPRSLPKALNPSVVLAIAAHPDDLEFRMGGTLAKYAALGASVHMLIVTDGSKGSSSDSAESEALAKQRQDEQNNALKVLGGKSVTFLQYCDGELEVSLDLKKDIVRQIRTIKPDVVVTMDPALLYFPPHNFVNHPDHRAASQATLDAVFPLARDRLAFPELLQEGLNPHKTRTVLLFNLQGCNYFEDISSTFDTKVQAMLAHKSQVENKEDMKKIMLSHASECGEAAKMTLAESYVRIDLAV